MQRFSMLKIEKNNLLYLCISVIAIIILLCITNGKMGNDEGIWSYMARVWVENGIEPYEGTLDDKPSGIILLNTLSYVLLDTNFYLLRLLAGSFIIVTGIVLYKLNWYLFDKRAGLFAFLIYSFAMLWEITNGAKIAQSETFMVFFSSLAFYLYLTRHDEKGRLFILIGTILGLALTFKQIAALSVGTILLLILIHEGIGKRFVKRVVQVTISCVIIFVLFQLPIVHSKTQLVNFIKFAWLNPNYYPTLFWRIPGFLDIFWNSKFMLIYLFLLLLFPFRKHIFSDKFYLKPLLVWLLFTFIGVNLSGHYYGHQITQMLPPVSLLSGMAITVLIDKLGIGLKKTLLILSLLFAPLPLMVHNLTSILVSPKELLPSIKSHITGNSVPKKIGIWLKERTNNEEYIYYYGRRTNQILSYSDRLSSTKYFNTIRFVNHQIPHNVVRNLKTKSPKFIIKDKYQSPCKPIDIHIRKKYKKYKSFKYWLIYKFKS